MHCDIDPLTPKLRGHILNSWWVLVWSFMMIGVKGKQLFDINLFQLSMHCDLDLWPLDCKIDMAHPGLMESMESLCVKFHDNKCKGKAVMHRNHFTYPCYFWLSVQYTPSSIHSPSNFVAGGGGGEMVFWYNKCSNLLHHRGDSNVMSSRSKKLHCTYICPDHKILLVNQIWIWLPCRLCLSIQRSVDLVPRSYHQGWCYKKIHPEYFHTGFKLWHDGSNWICNFLILGHKLFLVHYHLMICFVIAMFRFNV